ncbi:hypothetical protein Tco_0154891 [Tanacetum coccineum]
MRSLMFVMICTRPDIAHVVGVVSRYMSEHGRDHWEAVKRILRYIKGTLDVAFCFGESDLIVRGYVDSDYASDIDGSKSTNGYVFAFCDRIVKTVNGEIQLQALVDAKKIIVTEASVRRDLQLNDGEGMDCLPNATIFEELTRMGSNTNLSSSNSKIIVGIKRLLHDLEVTAAKVRVAVAKLNLVLFSNLNEKYAK